MQHVLANDKVFTHDVFTTTPEAYVCFPALGTGCVFSLQVLIGSSVVSCVAVKLYRVVPTFPFVDVILQ